MPEPSQLQQLTAGRLEKERHRGALILDTRPTEKFASFHIVGSMQIGLMGSFSSWAAILLRPSQRILLIAEDENSAQEAQSRLARVGLENVDGYALADKEQWQQTGIELGSLPIYQCEDIRAPRADWPPQIIDVRSRAEWLQGQLSGAISVPLLELNPRTRLIDPSRPIFVYCQDGYRATIAASLLSRECTGHIGILTGSVQELQACDTPPETPQVERSESSLRLIRRIP
ncbi:rhodanese-like domain-containing protein [Silvibacterium bohemicum]|uniref:rhodanese-like domain-containing protein n=1 Tax=Silvibacterium bohemicum TaxID=1577686 RepID=UPI00161B78D4|nr:rhodanese-like domain-containing protein [Silvibacterium bohemicum]